ncbi:MAG TPA: rod shape-determining protein RodA [Planctomycetota bacterium]|nr:rod shape-determining protein RodA [Planctomycetota bacterium]
MTAEPLQVRRLDPLVVGSVAALALLGWMLQIGIRTAAPEGSVEKVTGFDEKQLQWYAVGVFASVLVLLVPYRVVLDRAYLVFAASLLLLLAVFAIGKSVKGAQRWIDLGPASLQPSEFAKIALVVVLARYIRFREDQKTLRGLAIPFLLAAIPVALILRQPDLGTALLFIPVLAAVLYASGARPRHLGLVAVMGIASAPVIYFAALKPYQRERVKTFLALTGGSETDPDAERLRRQEGWQSDQARLAVASGGLFGLGHAQGPQNRAGAVPEHQTDFVFTVLAEEWGFLGTLAMVAIYGGLFTGLAGIARRTRDPAGKLLVTGVIALLGVQAFVNLAMTVGLGPVTGVPLPFLSYGGSTTLTSFVAVALALNVGARPGFDFGPSDFR